MYVFVPESTRIHGVCIQCSWYNHQHINASLIMVYRGRLQTYQRLDTVLSILWQNRRHKTSINISDFLCRQSRRSRCKEHFVQLSDVLVTWIIGYLSCCYDVLVTWIIGYLSCCYDVLVTWIIGYLSWLLLWHVSHVNNRLFIMATAMTC